MRSCRVPAAGLIESIARGSGDLLVLGRWRKDGAHPGADGAARVRGRAGAKVGSSPSRVSAILPRAPGWKLPGVRTLTGDLLDPEFLRELPDSPDVVFMAGRKFGSTGAEHLTWVMNAHLPGLVARRFREASCVVFSTAAVYPFTAADGPGADEGRRTQSQLGSTRSRAWRGSGCSSTRPTPGVCASALIRLSYALDLRYGVLHDIGASLRDGQAVDLAMSRASVIWQGDACDLILRTLEHTSAPPLTLNVSGLEPIRIRDAAVRVGAAAGSGAGVCEVH